MPGLFDRIKDTWIAASPTLLTTLSTFAVTGAAPGGYQTFSTRYAISDANIPVAIVSQTSTDWMTCWCTYTSSNTLRIDTIMFSSNGDAGVTFPAGAMDIFVTPAARAIPGLREANTFTANNTFGATTYYGSFAHGNIGSDATQMFVRGNNIVFQNAANSTTYAYINSSGNVGIGTAVPASKLVVSAAAYNASQDAAYLVAGTTSYTGATTNWGTYGFAHKLKSTAGGVARVALDAITAGGLTEIFCADTSGNFGIGTPTPNRKLTVSASGADARINIIDSDTTASTAVSVIEFFGSDARGGYVGIVSGALALLSEAALANGIQISANGAERMRITNTGNVGIGTPSPSSPLVVNTGSGNFDAFLGANGTISIGNTAASGTVAPGIIGVAAVTAGLRLTSRTADANTDGDLIFDVRPTAGGDFATVTTRAYSFTRYGTTLATILRNGNVGIGTTSPGEKLSVATGASEFAIEWAGPGKAWVLGSAAGRAYIRNKTDSVEAISILNDGRVGIGTTGPSSPLHVVSASNFQPQIISEHIAGAGTGAAYFMLDRARGTPSAKTAVVSGDELGTLMARGHDGSAIQNSAWIAFDVGGTVSAGNVPSSITMFTTPVGGASASRMRISANGYVSIGTNSPSALLTIDDNAAAGTGLVLTGGGSGGNLASFIRDVGAGGAVKINASSGDPQVVFESAFNTFTIGTDGNDFKVSDDPILGNNDRLTINSSGNVGVGVSAPSFRFVAGNSSTDGGWIYSSGGVSYLGLGGFSGASDGAFQISYDRSNGNITLNGGTRDTPTPRVRIDSVGKVGINQQSPVARLHITDADSAISFLVSGATRGLRIANTPTGPILEGVDHTGTGSYQPLTVGGSDVRFTTSNNERMRISSSGAISFHSTFDPGILSVNIGAGLLRVYRQNTSGEGGQIEIARSADNGAAWYIDVIGSSTNSPDELRFVDAHNAAVRFNFTARGVAGIVNDQGPVSTDTLAVGFRGSPNNDKSANYTLALTDAGRTIRKTVLTAFTVTIPADATVNFPLGTCIMLCNVVNGTQAYNTTNNLVIACAAGGPTLVWLNGTAKNNRTPGINTLLRIGGSATLRKVAANLWTITGAGIA